MKIYDKDYSYVSNGENSKFLIDGKDGSEKRGQSFYKYYPLNDNSVDALTHLYVYATHPNQFNDPFDCATNLINGIKNTDKAICLTLFYKWGG